MKLLKVFLIISLFALVSCSNNKKKASNQPKDNTVAEMEQESDFIVDSDEKDLELSSDSTDEMNDFTVAEEPAVETMVMENTDNSTSISMTEGVGTYQIEKGDTLMLIAFKLYGDYRKWKSLQDMNPGLSSGSLAAGGSLKYSEPSEKFVWNPAGLPYLIKNGDSLGSISNEKYGTVSKWKQLYENNKPMIQDPNLIFAGFTMYYVPERDVASE